MAKRVSSIDDLVNDPKAVEGKDETDYARVSDGLGKKVEAEVQAEQKRELVITGLERFKGPIPFDQTTPLNERELHEIVDDWEGWFFLRDGYLYPIVALNLNEAANAVSLQSGRGSEGLVSSYPKDTIVYR